MVADLTSGSADFSPASSPTLVVKVGSALLVEQSGGVRREWLSALVSELAERVRAGQRIVVVSSGSIALGARRLGLEKGGRASLADAQAAASVGQIALSGLWSELFEAEGLLSAQILLALPDFEDRRRYLTASNALGRLLELGAVPIINENDSVATDEIRFGDNDRLAARVAQAADADGVILLSDIDGLYDRNPADPDARHIAMVEELTPEILAMADGTSASGMGTGGMAVKLEAARIANLSGIPLAIISGRPTRPIEAWSAGGRGTVFRSDRNEGARKSWLGAVQHPAGRIHVDAGAAKALRNGNSLLAAGARRMEGDFGRGDVVAIVDADGRNLAHGLVEYDVADALRIMGRRSEEIEALLGYSPRRALVHRDHMVML